MPAVNKKSMQKLSWNKAIAYDAPAINTTRKVKSASSSGLSTGLQARLENHARATALQNKSNVMPLIPNSGFTETPMKKPGTTPLNTTIKKTISKSVNTTMKKPTESEGLTIEFDNGEHFETYPPREEMHIPPEIEDDFEDIIPKACRLNDKDISRFGHLSGCFMQSPHPSDEDDDDDWKLDVLSLPLQPFPIHLSLKNIDEEEAYYVPVSVISDIEYSSDEDATV